MRVRLTDVHPRASDGLLSLACRAIGSLGAPGGHGWEWVLASLRVIEEQVLRRASAQAVSGGPGRLVARMRSEFLCSALYVYNYFLFVVFSFGVAHRYVALYSACKLAFAARWYGRCAACVRGGRERWMRHVGIVGAARRASHSAALEEVGR